MNTTESDTIESVFDRADKNREQLEQYCDKSIIEFKEFIGEDIVNELRQAMKDALKSTICFKATFKKDYELRFATDISIIKGQYDKAKAKDLYERYPLGIYFNSLITDILHDIIANEYDNENDKFIVTFVKTHGFHNLCDEFNQRDCIESILVCLCIITIPFKVYSAVDSRCGKKKEKIPVDVSVNLVRIPK